jgi:hypothetical protein
MAQAVTAGPVLSSPAADQVQDDEQHDDGGDDDAGDFDPPRRTYGLIHFGFGLLVGHDGPRCQG